MGKILSDGKLLSVSGNGQKNILKALYVENDRWKKKFPWAAKRDKILIRFIELEKWGFIRKPASSKLYHDGFFQFKSLYWYISNNWIGQQLKTI